MPPKNNKLLVDTVKTPLVTEALSTTQAPNGALIDAILAALTAKLDVEELSQILVDQVTDRLANSITLSDLADTIATQHREEINARLAQMVLASVRRKA
jgi:FixJ family two-component response regulator